MLFVSWEYQFSPLSPYFGDQKKQLLPTRYSSVVKNNFNSLKLADQITLNLLIFFISGYTDFILEKIYVILGKLLFIFMNNLGVFLNKIMWMFHAYYDRNQPIFLNKLFTGVLILKKVYRYSYIFLSCHYSVLYQSINLIGQKDLGL